jgi:twinfilin-like protein
MSYVPDKAKVREKMVYSSTKATLKLQLGGGLFVQEIFGTVPKDFTLESYNKYIASQQAEAPLTRAEMDRKEEEESGGVFVGGQGTGAIPGVQFPVEENVLASLKKLKDGSINYVQLIIDPNRERYVQSDIHYPFDASILNHVVLFGFQNHFGRCQEDFACRVP